MRLATWLPFGVAAQLTAAFRHVAVSGPTVRRATKAAEAALVAHEAAVIERLERERPIPSAGPARQQLSVDGAMVGLVGGDWRRRPTGPCGPPSCRTSPGWRTASSSPRRRWGSCTGWAPSGQGTWPWWSTGLSGSRSSSSPRAERREYPGLGRCGRDRLGRMAGGVRERDGGGE